MVLKKLVERRIFEGRIEALTALHVGSGAAELKGEATPVIKDEKGAPYIPGSSIKGKVRSELERIARALEIEVCNTPDIDRMCGSSKESEEELCIACRIFGTAGRRFSRASKVKFRDAHPIGDVKIIERTGTAIDRETGTVWRSALYTVEMVPAGAVFRFEMVAENLEDLELKLLLAALKSVEDTAIGGQTTRGFGKVKIHVDKMTVRTAEYYVGKAEEKVMQGEELAKWIEENRRL
jgi:CRISPR-associated protein Csm3